MCHYRSRERRLTREACPKLPLLILYSSTPNPHARVRACIHTRTRVERTHAHVRTHARTHAGVRAHTYTHTHGRTQPKAKTKKTEGQTDAEKWTLL